MVDEDDWWGCLVEMAGGGENQYKVFDRINTDQLPVSNGVFWQVGELETVRGD